MPCHVSPVESSLKAWRRGLVGARRPEEPRGCFQRSVCQANAVLAREYGGAGRVIATLMSNVGSRLLSGSDPQAVRETLDAARTGRRRRETTTHKQAYIQNDNRIARPLNRQTDGQMHKQCANHTPARVLPTRPSPKFRFPPGFYERV
ncbi:hypothetical protein C7M84_010884 [Penaeus vannamei]|uniref:Uncharacterized protein n=1 Tax=Penaeus vannamei TaxID=6689 RepID=A0A3R7NZ22_PENVA|nr:hypothetical protein C7M84_010884 [Penaeus vannamei]